MENVPLHPTPASKQAATRCACCLGTAEYIDICRRGLVSPRTEKCHRKAGHTSLSGAEEAHEHKLLDKSLQKSKHDESVEMRCFPEFQSFVACNGFLV
eukprot:169009-Amphidinium_carterae.1